MTYVNTDITFRGAILRWSLPGEDRCRQNEVITLEETALTHTPQAHIGIFILSFSKGWRPTNRPSSGNHPRAAWRATGGARQWPHQRVMNCLAVGGGDGGNNRCQSSLQAICCLSKFQIILQLRRKMKARMFSSSDILINYSLHKKNWLTLCHLGVLFCSLRCKISHERSP